VEPIGYWCDRKLDRASRLEKTTPIAAPDGNIGAVFLYASKRMKADKEVVRAAATQNGEAIIYACEALRMDKELDKTIDCVHMDLRIRTEFDKAAMTRMVTISSADGSPVVKCPYSCATSIGKAVQNYKTISITIARTKYNKITPTATPDGNIGAIFLILF